MRTVRSPERQATTYRSVARARGGEESPLPWAQRGQGRLVPHTNRLVQEATVTAQGTQEHHKETA